MKAQLRKWQSGVTAIELLIVMALIAILSSIAVPSYRNLILRNNVSSEGNKIVGALQFARTKATTGSFEAGLCPGKNTGVACDGASNAYSTDGFHVYTKLGTATPKVIEAIQQATADTRIVFKATTNGKDEIAFNRLGRLSTPYVAGVRFTVCYDDKSTVQVPGLLINVSGSGRVQSQKMDEVATCDPDALVGGI